ncbi:MAG TPA: hypothetical protein PK078_14130, partial [Anaerolineales bacterium]|nr:hypothetical protein [Anaerolineales bacterium]
MNHRIYLLLSCYEPFSIGGEFPFAKFHNQGSGIFQKKSIIIELSFYDILFIDFPVFGDYGTQQITSYWDTLSGNGVARVTL